MEIRIGTGRSCLLTDIPERNVSERLPQCAAAFLRSAVFISGLTAMVYCDRLSIVYRNRPY